MIAENTREEDVETSGEGILEMGLEEIDPLIWRGQEKDESSVMGEQPALPTVQVFFAEAGWVLAP